MTISFSQAFGGGGSSTNRYQRLYLPFSTTISAPFTGICRARVMGTGGSGSYYSSDAGGGNGGSVGIVTAAVTQNDSVVVVVGAGGASVLTSNMAGNQGSIVSITWPGVTASIPGGRGGVQGASPAANANPTGFDEFWLGGLGGSAIGGTSASGGGAAPLLHGTTMGATGGVNEATVGGGGAGVGGAGVGGAGGGSGSSGSLSQPGTNLAGQLLTTAALVDEYHSRLLVNVSGGGGGSNAPGGPGGGGGGSNASAVNGQGGFGAGGGGSAQTTSGFRGGSGGRGGGGGGTNANGGSGKGGDGFIVLEFWEV